MIYRRISSRCVPMTKHITLEALRSMRIPFSFTSGYQERDLSDIFSSHDLECAGMTLLICCVTDGFKSEINS